MAALAVLDNRVPPARQNSIAAAKCDRERVDSVYKAKMHRGGHCGAGRQRCSGDLRRNRHISGPCRPPGDATRRRSLGHCNLARHRGGRGSRPHRRRHDLERHHRRPFACRLRWPEGGGARGRFHPDSKPWHCRRQSLQRLSRRRWHSAAADARCDSRASFGAGHKAIAAFILHHRLPQNRHRAR